MSFSATDAALEGFRIAKERPVTMLCWGVASLAISIGSSLGMVTLFGGSMNEFMEVSRNPSPDPAQAMALMGQMGAFYLFLLPVVLLIFSIFTAAVYRTVLRPSDNAFAYLRLGADEFRLAVVMVVLTILSFVLSMLAVFLVILVAAIVGGGLAASMGGSDASTAGMVGGVILLVVLIYAVMIFFSLAFWTKFSLAGPMTFAEKRIRIFESWGATKGKFWSLFGCYLLAAILGFVVSILGGVISFSVMVGLGGMNDMAGGLMGMLRGMEPDYTSLQAFFTPAMIANMAINSFFSALTYAIFLAPAAVAYRDLAQKRG